MPSSKAASVTFSKIGAATQLAAGIRTQLGASSTLPKLTIEERLALLLEINKELAREHSLPSLLEKVTDQAISLLNAERGFVLLVQDGALVVHTSRDRQGDDAHATFSRSIAEKAIATGEPVVTLSALEDERMAGFLSVHQLNVQSVACVPIHTPKQQAIGALYLETRVRPGMLFHAELPTLLAFADQAAIAIENAHLIEENRKRADELAKTNEELKRAHDRLGELLGHRTAQLESTRRDLKSTRAVLRGHFGYQGLVGTSEKMRRVYALIDRLKDMDVPILITGESGTGKEVVARAIHSSGSRAKLPFTGINCGAIPENLLESELFGHVKGAFTGADKDRKGLFRETEGGTILLDEIGEMPHKMQAGLLRVLQESVVRPVGGIKEEPVSARVIAATHRSLEKMVAENTFREDLFYRLHVVELFIPPLRDRVDDIPVLIDHFLQIFAARYRRERKTISREALRFLSACPWPGNVRQLENALLNAWVMSDRSELVAEDFELSGLRRPSSAPKEDSISEPLSAQADSSESQRVENLEAHEASEKERILEALAACNWNRVKAAERVGMPRRTFYRRLAKHGIQ
jgi:transcriptional regulator with GAF, ATPase, and Fis domain